MACVGIFIDAGTKTALFNHDLLLSQGQALIMHYDFNGDPEVLRKLVQDGLRKTAPYVVVGFLDPYAEIEDENAPASGDYAFVISQTSPMYSRGIH